MIMGKYFGTDGIRGKSPEWLTPDVAYRIGYALGDGLKVKELLIGRDTRSTGLMLNEALNQGAMDAGVKTTNLGIVSTPMIQYLSLKKQIHGAMITASHNPASDNGIKILVSGSKTNENQELIIESYIENNNLCTSKIHSLVEEKSLLNDYLEDIKALDFPQTHIDVFIDSANGSLSDFSEKLIGQYADIIGLIGNRPNGSNINDNVGSTNLKSLLKDKPLGSIGLAFDGDGDRLIAIDEEGNIVTGDQIISIINQYMKFDNKIVFTKMLNPGIINSLNSLNIKFIQTDIGDKYILKEMASSNTSIGGEDSGHMIFKSLWPIGDGLVSALLLLNVLHVNSLTLTEAAKQFKKYPENLINFKNISKECYQSNQKLINQLELIKKKIEPKGKLLVRPSGTEPVIRVYISTKESSSLKDYETELLQLFQHYGGTV